MADIFQKCDDFWRRARRKGGDNFDELLGTFKRVYPITNCTPYIEFNGRRMLQVATNDYLGLATHPEAIAAAAAVVSEHGAGTPLGARPLTGSTELHVELEEKLAAFRRTEACLVHNLGLGAMTGTIASLVGRKDHVIVDSFAHGCVHDGARLSRGTVHTFRHNDMEDLENRLRECPIDAAKLICVDGVYGMSGDLCPLPEIVELKNRYGAQLLVDDAHGTGVLGENGRGTAEHFGLEDEVELHGGTFAKSFGTFGGYMAGPRTVMEFLRLNSQAFVLTKSLPAAQTAQTLKALELMQRLPERRTRLWENLNALRSGLRAGGLDVGNPQGAVTSVWTRGVRALPAVRALEEEYGILANLVMYPAVPQGTSIIRMTLSAMHSLDDVAKVVDALTEINRRFHLQDSHEASEAELLEADA